MKPTYFENPEQFRAWLAEHHASAGELLVGFRRTKSGLPSMTWPESVDEALCYGWIDGLRRGLDETSYTIRFTPRKKASTWSAINLRRVNELIAEGRMTPAGIEAWENRRHSRDLGYTYDGPTRVLGPDERAKFEQHPEAWTYFQGQAPSYQRAATHWVMSAKRQETRDLRLANLIEDSSKHRRLERYSKYSKKS